MDMLDVRRPGDGSDHRLHPLAFVAGGVVLLGALLTAVPSFLGVLLDSGVPVWGRLLNLVLFVVPIGVAGYGGLLVLLRGLGRRGRAGAWPASRSGLVAVTLLAVVVVAASLGALLVALDVAGAQGAESFWEAGPAAWLVVLAWGAGAGALLSGLLALLVGRDRAGAVWVAVAAGWVVTVFGVGEVLVPH
ncbi:hypothetical protein [Aquipuribacter nitratireducens]|uniref:Uncharacterized protein n=1 Tax=Aquipuribacter nitratireducens TaxID=650104 RepID=A0ABW0GMD1_9MICO